MSALREVLASFTVNVDTSKLTAGAKGIDGAVEKLQGLGAALAGNAIIGGVKNFVASMVELGDSIAATSDKLGLGTTELQQWHLAAQLSDVGVEQFDASLVKFQKNLVEASEGTGAAASTFKDLGIEVTDANGQLASTPDILLGVADAIAEIEDPAVRNAKLMDLFGKQGAALGPMFSKGSEGIQELLAQLEATGGGLSEDAIEAMASLDDATIKYEASVTSLKGKIALTILPSITMFVEKISGVAAAFANSEGASTKLKSALGVLGVAGFIAGMKILTPYLGLALVIGAAILIVDDLVTGLKGGESVTGDLLDKIFGEGAGKSVFKAINDDLIDLRDKLKALPPEASRLEEVFSTVGASLTKFFAEELPEAVDVARGRIRDGSADATDWGIVIAGALNPVQWVKDFQKGLDDLTTKVNTWIDTTIASAKNLGSDFINSIVQGIVGATPTLDDAMGKAAQSMVDGIKNPLQQRSPSKVGIGIGDNFVGSIGMGGRQQLPMLARTGNEVAQTLTAPATMIANSSARNIANRVHQDNRYGPFIFQGAASQESIRRGVARSSDDANEALLNALESIV